MMFKRIAAAAALVYSIAAAPVLAADNAIILTPGVGVTERSKDVGSGVQSVIVILGDTSGNPLATAPGTPNGSFVLNIQGNASGVAVPISAASLPLPTGAATQTTLASILSVLGSPFQASGSIGNTGFNALQAGSANAVGNPFYVSPGTGATFPVSNAGTFAVQATLQASATTAIGKVDPNTIATWGLAALGGATAPPNALAVAAEYLTSAPTYTTGQTGALQMTAAGSLHTTVDNTATQVTPGNGISAPTGTAPSTSSPVTSFSEAYNGTTWDALQDDANKNLKVNLAASADACTGSAKTTINIGQTATSQIITGTSGKKTYICGGGGFTSAAATYGLEEGTGTTCGTGTHDVAMMNGSNNGTPFAALPANGGLTFGAGSGTQIIAGNATGDNVCLVQSGTANFGGWITYVQL